jgi:hypothetical protein
MAGQRVWRGRQGRAAALAALEVANRHWVEYADAEGDSYYHNVVTRETSWAVR